MLLFACELRCDEERTAERLFCWLALTVPEFVRADLVVVLLLTADVFRLVAVTLSLLLLAVRE